VKEYNFKIGDKVTILNMEKDDQQGVIVANGDLPKVTGGNVVPGKELQIDSIMVWWKVKIDGTSKIVEVPCDRIKINK
jgi:hypothetical protein